MGYERLERCQSASQLLHSRSNHHHEPLALCSVGIDIVGPLPTAPAQKKILLVVTDYFSKWIEAEAFASIKDKDVIQFLWKNIVCRFGIPQSIVTDNGSQFDSKVYKIFCYELKILMF